MKSIKFLFVALFLSTVQIQAAAGPTEAKATIVNNTSQAFTLHPSDYTKYYKAIYTSESASDPIIQLPPKKTVQIDTADPRKMLKEFKSSGVTESIVYRLGYPTILNESPEMYYYYHFENPEKLPLAAGSMMVISEKDGTFFAQLINKGSSPQPLGELKSIAAHADIVTLINKSGEFIVVPSPVYHYPYAQRLDWKPLKNQERMAAVLGSDDQAKIFRISTSVLGQGSPKIISKTDPVLEPGKTYTIGPAPDFDIFEGEVDFPETAAASSSQASSSHQQLSSKEQVQFKERATQILNHLSRGEFPEALGLKGGVYGASRDEARKKFREIQKKYHPDRVSRFKNPELTQLTSEITITLSGKKNDIINSFFEYPLGSPPPPPSPTREEREMAVSIEDLKKRTEDLKERFEQSLREQKAMMQASDVAFQKRVKQAKEEMQRKFENWEENIKRMKERLEKPKAQE